MEQLHLPMLTVYAGPRLVDLELVDACKSYRDAVRACWDLRTRRNLTKSKLAEDAGLYCSHVTDYLSEQAGRRDLPAKHINAFELACGNRFINQWLTRQASLTHMEQVMAAHQRRRAA